MSLFLETIKINNGRRENLDGHSKRMNRTRNAHFHEIRNIDLADVVVVPQQFRKGNIKCRITYGRNIEKVEFEKYVFRNPRSFQLVNADHIDYSFKFADREPLTTLFSAKGRADDIIMVKNDLITDSYFANLAFLKDDTWYTPAKPLLKGTFRELLLMNEKIVEVEILEKDLSFFQKIKLFNALTEWEMHQPVDCSQIFH